MICIMCKRSWADCCHYGNDGGPCCWDCNHNENGYWTAESWGQYLAESRSKFRQQQKELRFKRGRDSADLAAVQDAVREHRRNKKTYWIY